MMIHIILFNGSNSVPLPCVQIRKLRLQDIVSSFKRDIYGVTVTREPPALGYREPEKIRAKYFQGLLV